MSFRLRPSRAQSACRFGNSCLVRCCCAPARMKRLNGGGPLADYQELRPGAHQAPELVAVHLVQHDALHLRAWSVWPRPGRRLRSAPARVERLARWPRSRNGPRCAPLRAERWANRAFSVLWSLPCAPARETPDALMTADGSIWSSRSARAREAPLTPSNLLPRSGSSLRPRMRSAHGRSFRGQRLGAFAPARAMRPGGVSLGGGLD